MKASEFEAVKAYCRDNDCDINFLNDGEVVEIYRNGYMTTVLNHHELAKAVMASKMFEEAGWTSV